MFGEWKDAINDPPKDKGNVLVTDGNDFTIAYYNGGEWLFDEVNSMLEAENWDGRAHISLDSNPQYWMDLPSIPIIKEEYENV